MIVIVDGCDKTGKSTLAKSLVSALGFSYHHAGVSKEPDLYSKYNDLISQLKDPTIADRFYTSEIVYGPLIRGRSRLSVEQFNELNMKVASGGGCFVHCFAPLETLVKRFESDKEEYALPQLIGDLLDGFKNLADTLRQVMPVLEFDSGAPQEVSIRSFEKIVAFLRQRAAG